MLASLVNRVFSRTFLFMICIFLLISWLLYGNSALRELGQENSKTTKYVQEQVERLRRTNPEAGAALADIARTRDIRAVAASLRMYDRETNGNPVRALAKDLAQNREEGLRWYTLSAIGIENYSSAPAHERDSFLDTYGAVYQNTLELDPSGAMADDYATLFSSAKDDSNWGILADDPAALVFRRVLADDSASWEYYARERDWLNEILVSLPVPEDDVSLYAPTVLEAVQTIRRYYPAFKKAYQSKFGNDSGTDPMIGVALLELFEEYGDFLLAADKEGLPIEEMVDILYANRSEFEFSEEPSLRVREVRNAVARMLTIRANKPQVWITAPEEMNVLWLEKAAPDQAEYVMGAYGGGDVPTLLFTYYENEAAAAAQALVVYGDIGLYTLTRYREDGDFKRHLADERIGIRVIPFILRFPQNGFVNLQSNIKWVDKYFNPDGSERDQGWIKDIPLVGGPINVIGNVLGGVPNTWGEIGWAAFDVADCALIVATFGSSAAASAVSQGTKQAGTQGVKLASKQAVKRQVRNTVAKKVGVGLAAKTTGRVATGTIAKTIGRQSTRSLLFRVVQSGYQSIRWGLRTTVSAGSQTWKVMRTTWRSIPPPARRIITGTLATAMFCYSYDRRNTPAAIKKGMESLGKQAGKTINAVGAGVASGLTQAVNETLGGAGRSLSETSRRLLWLVAAVVFAIAVFKLRPSRDSIKAFMRGI